MANINGQIISASYKTDIPGFYSEWFFDKIHKGSCQIRTWNYSRIISLKPQDVAAIVFWTKNARPMLEHLEKGELKEYNYYFQYTINGYGRTEPNVPELENSIETFQNLSRFCYTIWRYDPIFLSPEHSLKWHITNFQAIARKLAGYTDRCVVSFLDVYGKIQQNMALQKIRPPKEDEVWELMKEFARIAKENGITIFTCSESIELNKLGIKHGACIDGNLMHQKFGIPLKAKPKKAFGREACGCVASIDIGAYNTCCHNCLYCYANSNKENARKNLEKHNPYNLFM